MTDEVQPRVWVGESRAVAVSWRWNDVLLEWTRCVFMLRWRVFVPGNHPKPTADPAEMETIATAKVVDWT